MNTAIELTLAVLAVVSLAVLVLWWLADHRRGIAWAISFMRWRFPEVSHLAPSALDGWLRDAQRTPPQIVDARTEEEFAVSHLAGARRIDPKANASTSLSQLDAERPIVIYCSAGYRSATLARRLQNAGRREVWNLEGGIFGWANNGLPVERAGQTTQSVHPYSRIFARLLKRDRRQSKS